MLRRFQTVTLALLTALLIILGGFGIFIAEAASVQGIIIEAHTYDPGVQIDAFDYSPGLPY